MATNDFLIFDESGTNMQAQADYSADSQRSGGIGNGDIARSIMHNKLFHQISTMAYAIGEFIKALGTNASDSNSATLVAALQSSIASKPALDAHTALTAGTGAHGLDSSSAKFKASSSTYTDNDTSQTFTDTFCTANSLVVVSITGTTPQGTWTVTSGNGSFTITSSAAESADVTFDYYITKVV